VGINIIKMKRKNMMKNYKDTYQNTLIASGKQNFQGEVISGFVMKLLEITRENIREAQKEKQRKGEPCWHIKT